METLEFRDISVLYNNIAAFWKAYLLFLFTEISRVLMNVQLYMCLISKNINLYGY